MKTASHALLCAFFAVSCAGCGSEGANPSAHPVPTTGSEPLPEASSPVGPNASDGATTSNDEATASEAALVTDAPGNTIADASTSSDSGDRPGWQLVWSDEFNGAAGTKPD